MPFDWFGNVRTRSLIIAVKYQDLYTSVPYDASDMAEICSEVDSSLTTSEHTCAASFAEVYDAVRKIKPGKSDGLRFAEAVSGSKGRDFWNEVKRIRRSGSGCSNCIDGLTSADDIALPALLQ